MTGTLRQRPAQPGERCTCGRAAVLVFVGGRFGYTGYCGIPDGGARSQPCPFCGQPRERHLGRRCPDYQLCSDASAPRMDAS